MFPETVICKDTKGEVIPCLSITYSKAFVMHAEGFIQDKQNYFF